MQKIKWFSMAMLVVFAASVSAHHLKGHNLKERIKPSGGVYVEGDDVPVAKPAVVKTAGPRTGEQIYKSTCSACHATGAAGAPKVGDSAAWSVRIAQGEAVLFEHATKGLNGTMPPMGTCADCSVDELKETVKYMVANSQ